MRLNEIGPLKFNTKKTTLSTFTTAVAAVISNTTKTGRDGYLLTLCQSNLTIYIGNTVAHSERIAIFGGWLYCRGMI